MIFFPKKTFLITMEINRSAPIFVMVSACAVIPLVLLCILLASCSYG
jgi:hypothetical protein